MILEMLQKPSAQKDSPNKDGLEGLALMKRHMKKMEGANAERLSQLIGEMEELVGSEGEYV